MRYDRHGFPIPAEFERPAPVAREAADFGRIGSRPAVLDHDGAVTAGRQRAGAWKRWLLIAIIFGGVLPAIVLPQVLPVIREAVRGQERHRGGGYRPEPRAPLAG